jgi:hypothetical protein
MRHPDTPPAIKITQLRMRCVGCGAETGAVCSCGMTYEPVQQRVAEYDKANPGQSTRQAATDLGVSKSAIHKARAGSGVHEWTPAAVTGRDHKTYPATKPAHASPIVGRKATLAEYHSANRAMGVLRYFISEFDALELAQVANGCSDQEVEKVAQEIELAAKHLNDFREAMRERATKGNHEQTGDEK